MAGLDALYLTDEQIARRLGRKPAEWRAAAALLERDGLPRRDPLFGDCRWWPAVVAFLDRRNGLAGPSAPRQWEENFNGKRSRVEAPTSR